MPEKANVIRQRPRDRSKLEGLCGVIYTTLLSESYIHVGSSLTPLKLNEELLTKLIKNGKKDIRSLLQAAKFMEIMRFNISGGQPVIPGSSIKGNIRSRLELSFRPKDGYVRSCFIRARAPLTEEPLRGMHGWRHFKIWGGVLFEERGLPCDLIRMDKICLICDLFGTTGLKSLIDFSDFIGDGYAEDMLEQLSLEYGMNLIAAKPGSRFNGKITFYNLSPSEIGLLLIGMRVGKSALLGRLKYRHRISGLTFGKVRYDVRAIKFLKESQDFEIGGLRFKGDDYVDGSELTKIMEEFKSLANDEFKSEIFDVDEVTIIEQLSGG